MKSGDGLASACTPGLKPASVLMFALATVTVPLTAPPEEAEMLVGITPRSAAPG